MPTSVRGGALPTNPVSAVLGGSKPPQGSSLPANSLSASLGGETAPTASQGQKPLTGYASRIVNEQIDPAFVQHLKVLNAADPTFQDRLNAEIKRVSGQIEAKQNSGPLAIAGNVIEGAANPLEWVKGAIEGVPQVGHGVAKAVGGNLAGGAEQAGLGALGVAGVLPFGRAAGVIGDAISAGRTAEEAASHIDEAVARAKAEGFGNHVGSKGNPPVVGKGVADPATGGELGRQIREALPHAPAVRKTQKAGFSEERAARFKAAGEEHVKAGGGAAGFAAGARQLEGELGREFFGHLKHLTQGHLDEAAKIIDQAPLQYGEKLHAFRSLKNAIENGVAPTKGDHALLERVFGTTKEAADTANTSSFWDKFVSYTNIPRAIRSSADISAGLRQGLVVLVTHPKVWGNAWLKSVKEFGSENYYQAQQAAIHNDPWFPLLSKWGVPFTEIGGKVKNTEEAFIGGQAAEHMHELPGIKGTPVSTALRPVSNIVRRSDRAFTGFQNEVRFQLAKQLGEKAALIGHDLNDEHLGQSIARVVGTFSGRGVTPKILEGHLTTLNALMFSPRLMAARMNLLSPVYYYKLDPFARQEALAGARNLVAAIGTVMYTAKLLGADVTLDPRSSNFTKIKIGNTRIDIAGGFSQYVRLIAQQMTGEEISSAGTKSRVRYPGQSVAQGDISTLDNLTKFARSKAAPIPSTLWDELSGKDFIGKPIKQGHEAFSNAPFVTQDAYDALQNSGSKSVVVAAFLSAIGLGVQSYKDKPPKTSNGGGVDGYWGDSGSTTGGDSGQGYWGP